MHEVTRPNMKELIYPYASLPEDFQKQVVPQAPCTSSLDNFVCHGTIYLLKVD